MVGQVGRAPADAEQQHEGRQRRGGPAQPAQQRRLRQQVAVDVVGVGVRDDHVRRQPAAAGEPHPGDPVAGRLDPGHLGAGADLPAERDDPAGQLVGERAQPAAQVPAAEPLLHVRHDAERGRGPARVRSGVRRVPLEQRALPRVGQVALTEPAQRAAGRDRAQVADPDGLPGQVAHAADRRLEERAADRLPDPLGAGGQPAPVRARRRPERGVHPGAGHVQVPGGVQPGAVGEPVPDQRVERLQLQPGRPPVAGRREQVGEHLRHGQQRRAGVEPERAGRGVPLQPAELAADHVGLLADRHLVAAGGEAGGGGEPAQPADHRRRPRTTAAHGSRRPFQVSVPARWAAQRARGQPAERGHRDGVRQRVRPGPAAGAPRGQHPSGHPGSVSG